MSTGRPPWDIDRPQPAFLELLKARALWGSVLDVGCGTGEHALMAAEAGLDATGIDLAAAAVERAESKARERGLTVRFMVHDAAGLALLGEQYHVLDSGLFHVLDDRDRVRFVDGLRAVIVPGGLYHLLCFSDRQSGDWGPRRVTQHEIRTSFTDGWRVDRGRLLRNQPRPRSGTRVASCDHANLSSASDATANRIPDAMKELGASLPLRPGSCWRCDRGRAVGAHLCLAELAAALSRTLTASTQRTTLPASPTMRSGSHGYLRANPGSG